MTNKKIILPDYRKNKPWIKASIFGVFSVAGIMTSALISGTVANADEIVQDPVITTFQETAKNSDLNNDILNANNEIEKNINNDTNGASVTNNGIVIVSSKSELDIQKQKQDTQILNIKEQNQNNINSVASYNASVASSNVVASQEYQTSLSQYQIDSLAYQKSLILYENAQNSYANDLIADSSAQLKYLNNQASYAIASDNYESTISAYLNAELEAKNTIIKDLEKLDLNNGRWTVGTANEINGLSNINIISLGDKDSASSKVTYLGDGWVKGKSWNSEFKILRQGQNSTVNFTNISIDPKTHQNINLKLNISNIGKEDAIIGVDSKAWVYTSGITQDNTYKIVYEFYYDDGTPAKINSLSELGDLDGNQKVSNFLTDGNLKAQYIGGLISNNSENIFIGDGKWDISQGVADNNENPNQSIYSFIENASIFSYDFNNPGSNRQAMPDLNEVLQKIQNEAIEYSGISFALSYIGRYADLIDFPILPLIDKPIEPTPPVPKAQLPQPPNIPPILPKIPKQGVLKTVELLPIEYNLFQATSNLKDVVIDNGISVNNKKVVNGEELNYVLKNNPLEANRLADTNSLVIQDILPNGVITTLDKIQSKANTDYWNVTFDNQTITYTANTVMLDLINRDKTQTFNFEDFIIPVVVSLNDDNGGKLVNTFQTILNDSVISSNEVINPVIENPYQDNPNEDGDNPNTKEKQKKIVNVNGEDIDNKNLLISDEIQYEILWDLSDYTDWLKTATSQDENSLQKGMQLKDDYDDVNLTLKNYKILDQNNQEINLVNFGNFENVNGIATWNIFKVNDFLAMYGGQVLKAVLNMDINNLTVDGAEVENTAFQVDFGNQYETNTVKNVINIQNPIKTINLNGQDFNEQEIKLNEQFEYILASTKTPTNYGGVINSWIIKDKFDLAYDEIGNFTALNNKGEDISQFIKREIDQQTQEYSYSLTENYLKNLSPDQLSNFAWSVKQIAKRIKTGDVSNTFIEILNGEEINSNTVISHTKIKTIWQDIDGNILKNWIDGEQSHDQFPNYTFTETQIDNDGNIHHIFKQIVLPDPVTEKQTTLLPKTGINNQKDNLILNLSGLAMALGMVALKSRRF
ncbi:MAG: LPXTG cell wall anchor domain-containing protein [Lactobacillaceae bacterium]|jgi:surface repeat SSSPR-51 protein|nr:LPXTG cell wall anchor domain-containing protein [Lactobacillaceae bacterium]